MINNMKKFKAQAITKIQAMDIKGGGPVTTLEEYCATNRLIAANNPGERGDANDAYKEHCSDLPKSR